jgi:hypothetical protein
VRDRVVMVGVRDLVGCMLGRVGVVRVKAVMMQKIMFRIRVKVRAA